MINGDIYRLIMKKIVLIIFLMLYASLSYADTTTGLVGWWRFDDGAGASAVDSSGDGNTGTLVNTPTWTTGHLGGALGFNGTNQAITTTKASGITSTFTVSAWIYPTSYGSGGVTNETIYSKWDDDGNNRQFFLSLGGDGVCSGLQSNKLYIFMSSSGSWDACAATNKSFYSTSTISLNTWTFVTVTYDSTTAKIYINGFVDNSFSFAGPIFNSAAHIIFAGYDGSGNGLNGGPNSRYFPGIIDDIRMYSRTLSAGDVLQLYKTGTTVIKNARLHNMKINF